MEYAPIIIPTLNRLDHLKRCLHSLERNSGADKTEVYISVDYPPNERYVEGYLKLKEWLDSNANKLQFKEVHVYFQNVNLGAKDNSTFLENQIIGKADRYIYTEDDNEFSPNFLEYINQGLEIFEKDDRVLGICGAKDTEWIYGGLNSAFVKLFPAYGYGTWFSKMQYLKSHGQDFLLDKNTLSFSHMKKLLAKNHYLFNAYICNVLCKEQGIYWDKNELYWCDSLRSIYMHLSDHVCVVPLEAKSRTWGNDGTGINMAATQINPEEKWPLDKASDFAYPDIEKFEYYEENYKLGNKYLKQMISVKGALKAIVLYVLLLICGRDRKKVITIIEKIGLN